MQVSGDVGGGDTEAGLRGGKVYCEVKKKKRKRKKGKSPFPSSGKEEEVNQRTNVWEQGGADSKKK